MSLFKRTVEELKYNQQKRKDGKIIAIPFPFPRFAHFIPGIQQGRYVIVTANSKVGKTKMTDFVFVYSPVDYILNNPDCGADIKVDYFSLEMSKRDKMKQYIAHNLFKLHGIVLDEEEISSIYDRYILPDDVLRKIEALEPIMEKFESKVNFIDNTKNAYGIYKYVRDYYENNGQYYDKDNRVIPISALKNEDFKIKKDATLAINYYKQNNPDMFHETIVDHYGLFTPEKRDADLRASIANFSSNYAIKMRDRWKDIVIGVQQQTAAQEGVENIKLALTKPSANGLGINKNTQQDVDLLLGVYAPIRYKQRDYEGYNLAVPGKEQLPLGDMHREFFTIINRRGAGNVSTQLFFNGAANHFKELPKPEDKYGMEQVNQMIKLLNTKQENG